MCEECFEMVNHNAPDAKPTHQCPHCKGLIIYTSGGFPCTWCGIVLPSMTYNDVPPDPAPESPGVPRPR